MRLGAGKPTLLVWLLVKLQNNSNTDVVWLQYWIYDKHSDTC